jgi:hypothetical protein
MSTPLAKQEVRVYPMIVLFRVFRLFYSDIPGSCSKVTVRITYLQSIRCTKFCFLKFVTYTRCDQYITLGDRGSTVVKVLRYKSEGRWFDSRLCHEFFIYINSDRTMALVSTQPLTEMSTGSISWG